MELQNINQSEEDIETDENQVEIQQGQHMQIDSQDDKAEQLQYYSDQNKFEYYLKKFIYNWNNDNLFKHNVILSITFFSLYISHFFFAVNIDGRCPSEKFPVNDDCIELLIEVVPQWMFSLFMSASILVVIIMLSFYYKKIHHLNGILAAFQAYYFIFKYYGKLDIGRIKLRNMTIAHSFTLLIFIVLEFLIILYVLLGKTLYKKYRKAFYAFVSIQLIILIRMWYIAERSCDGWEKGLVHDLDFSEEYCEIKKPSVCWANIFDNTFNMGPDTCEIPEDYIYDYKINTLKNYEIIVKDETPEEDYDQILKDTKVIGWPLFNKLDSEYRTNEVTISEYLLENTKFYDTKEEVFKDGREVAVDVQNLKIDFNIERNQELVNERKLKNVEESLAKNIIIIYVDTVSRRQLYRKLKKTMAFMKRYANFESEEYEKEHLGAKTFESFRFHSLDKRTQDNVFKLRYNMMTKDWKNEKVQLDENNKIKSVFNDIKDAGYIFSHATNSLSIKSHLRNYSYKDKPLSTYFEDDPADHEMYMFDPNYLFNKNTYGVKKGANSIYRRCLYGKDTNHYVLDYGKKFLDAYKDDKKFLLLEFTDSHELTSEIVQYLDDNLYNFLVNLEDKGYLSNDTALFMMSDHGQHLISNILVFKKFQTESAQERDFYSIEKVLPFFMTTMTNDVLEKYQDKHMQETLATNEQRIFGMGEVRNTLLNTAYGYDYEYNYPKEMAQTDYNLYEELPTDRSCLDLGMNDLLHPYEYCSCKPDGDYDELHEKMMKKEKKQIEQWKKERKQQQKKKSEI